MATRLQRSVMLAGEFKAAGESASQREPSGFCHEQSKRASAQHRSLRGDFESLQSFGIAGIVLSPHYETMAGLVVIFNFFVMTAETNARATNDEVVSARCVVINQCLLAYYFVECSLRLHCLRRDFFTSSWNMLDVVIVAQGLWTEIMELVAANSKMFEQVSLLKSLRMLRMLRLVRLLVSFRELFVLVVGLGRCMKTLFWASGLIFLVLNMWAILSVEYLQEIVAEVAIENPGAFSTCTWCPTAFSNVWLANVTWFQIITGDGWSTIARPVIEKQAWTYIFFISNVFIVMWGLLNLIVAAIVDASVAARRKTW
jgi:voltage-gated sodium channel